MIKKRYMIGKNRVNLVKSKRERGRWYVTFDYNNLPLFCGESEAECLAYLEEQHAIAE